MSFLFLEFFPPSISKKLLKFYYSISLFFRNFLESLLYFLFLLYFKIFSNFSNFLTFLNAFFKFSNFIFFYSCFLIICTVSPYSY